MKESRFKDTWKNNYKKFWEEGSTITLPTYFIYFVSMFILTLFIWSYIHESIKPVEQPIYVDENTVSEIVTTIVAEPVTTTVSEPEPEIITDYMTYDVCVDLGNELYKSAYKYVDCMRSGDIIKLNSNKYWKKDGVTYYKTMEDNMDYDDVEAEISTLFTRIPKCLELIMNVNKDGEVGFLLNNEVDESYIDTSLTLVGYVPEEYITFMAYAKYEYNESTILKERTFSLKYVDDGWYVDTFTMPY